MLGNFCDKLGAATRRHREVKLIISAYRVILSFIRHIRSLYLYTFEAIILDVMVTLAPVVCPINLGDLSLIRFHVVRHYLFSRISLACTSLMLVYHRNINHDQHWRIQYNNLAPVRLNMLFNSLLCCLFAPAHCVPSPVRDQLARLEKCVEHLCAVLPHPVYFVQQFDEGRV